MADTGTGRHHAEIVERLLRPFEEFVALAVLSVFLVDVLFDRIIVGVIIHGHRVIADEIDRHQRIDLFRIAAQHLHGIAHGGEIDYRRHAGEILHQHARGAKRDFALRSLGLEPLRDRLQIFLGDTPAILVAQEIFQ